MSYCRFTEGDVYAYACDGGVQFYVADGKRELDRLCNTFNEAYQYARVLRDTHGLDVPSHAIEELKADAIEEAARICGSDSVVAELEAENAKLRELVRDYDRCTMYADCSTCEYDGKLSTHCPLSSCFPDADELRELGVEVDE